MSASDMLSEMVPARRRRREVLWPPLVRTTRTAAGSPLAMSVLLERVMPLTSADPRPGESQARIKEALRPVTTYG